MRRRPRTVSLIAIAALGAGACHIERSAPPTTTVSETAQAVDHRAPSTPAPAADKPEQPADEGGVAAPAEPAPAPPPPPATTTKAPRGVPMKEKTRVGSGSGHSVVDMGRAGARPMPAADPVSSTEDYRHYDANRMTLVKDDRLSTFAVDVDTASYAIARRKILEGQAVPADAVRVEEFLNYFKYGYEGPGDERPFAVHMEAAPSPFTPGRHLLRVGVQGRTVPRSQRKRADLVFLVDVSGSMQSPDKLPLAQRSLRILVDNLDERDTVALVTYAGSTRVVLEPTGLEHKAKIVAAIDELTAGGSTAMGSGLELAYRLAARRVSDHSISRVIVLSDGDANVGNTTQEAILATIQGKVREGVTLSTIGFGMGNYKDSLMEQLANKGNGNAYYIDSLSQAKRVFQEQLGGTLEVIAQDVKLQVEMNPAAVVAYRLVGYENRDIADRDFRNDKVDAGEIGAGHSVTALYEVELAAAGSGPLATVRVRAKRPRGVEAAEHEYPFARENLRASFAAASESFRFATAVTGFAEILRRSPYADGWKLADVLAIARAATPAGNAEREEFVELVGRAARVTAIARAH